MFFKKNRDSILFGIVLLAFTVYVLLDTFVIARPYEDAVTARNVENTENKGLEEADGEEKIASKEGGLENNGTAEDADSMKKDGKSGDSERADDSETTRHRNGKRRGKAPGSSDEVGNQDKNAGGEISDSDIKDDQQTSSANQKEISGDIVLSLTGGTVVDTYNRDGKVITLYAYRVEETEVYVADVVLENAGALQTAFAKDTYGKNVTAKTSEIASGQNAVLAVNGDYYGAREKGYVIRNGQLYRSTVAVNQEDLVIYNDGSVEVVNESEVTAETLLQRGAQQVLSFGPALLENGKIMVSPGEEVGKAMASNPRTAIGVIDALHYVFVVSDGRTSESKGLSLSELAAFMDSLGVRTAYNLDGGGSSTMYFKGQVVNQPTTSGRSIKERSVSDIVYIR